MGNVDKNGEGASKYKPGQRVVGVPWPVEKGEGTWQQYLVVKETVLVRRFFFALSEPQQKCAWGTFELSTVRL